jgi:nucleoside-diphosphate-sugar epimerase
MINRILSAAGYAPVKRRIPASLAWFGGAFLELIYGALKIKKEPPMTRFVARELSTSHWYDITAAKRDLGYTPRISVDEGMKRLCKWIESKSQSA